MKNTFAKKVTVCALAGVLGFALTACDDSSSASDDNNETSAVESSSSVTLSEASADSNGSSSEKDNPSSAGTSTKSSNSNSSSVTPSDVEGSSKTAWDYLNPGIDYGEFTDERDGQVYKTVKIGDQIWMAQNLNYAYTGVKFSAKGNTSDSTSWCYDNKVSNCDKYGRLYTWSAVMDSAAQFIENARTTCGYSNLTEGSLGSRCKPNSPHRGICPEGWHVPTEQEFSTLHTYIGGSNTGGLLLKSTSGWYSGGNGTDKYGFSVLSAGYRSYEGYFYDEGRITRLWTATNFGSGEAKRQGVEWAGEGLYVRYSVNNKRQGYSVRCVKDSE